MLWIFFKDVKKLEDILKVALLDYCFFYTALDAVTMKNLYNTEHLSSEHSFKKSFLASFDKSLPLYPPICLHDVYSYIWCLSKDVYAYNVSILVYTCPACLSEQPVQHPRLRFARKHMGVFGDG